MTDPFRSVDAEDQKLISLAAETSNRAHRPGRHGVGAALLCGSGRIYVGVCVESTHGVCAEPVAVGAAIAAGEIVFTKIVAAGYWGQVLSPCGNCRQLLLDYSPEMEVIFMLDGLVRKTEVKNLLPGAYLTVFE